MMVKGIGDEFQRNTKHSRERLLGSHLDWANKPETYKEYPSARNVQLPRKIPSNTLSLIEAIRKRKSVRSFLPKPLAVGDLSFLLWAATGIQRTEQGYEFRTAPSAGALYPIETYVIANNVEGLEKAVYHYNIPMHSLEELKTGYFGEKVSNAALGQKICVSAPVLLIWTAVFNRSKWKYDQRAYRYVYLDAGHIAQNLALSATSIGLGSCQIGAFFDDEINQIVEVDGKNESAVYLTSLGHPR